MLIRKDCQEPLLSENSKGTEQHIQHSEGGVMEWE